MYLCIITAGVICSFFVLSISALITFLLHTPNAPHTLSATQHTRDAVHSSLWAVCSHLPHTCSASKRNRCTQVLDAAYDPLVIEPCQLSAHLSRVAAILLIRIITLHGSQQAGQGVHDSRPIQGQIALRMQTKGMTLVCLTQRHTSVEHVESRWHAELPWSLGDMSSGSVRILSGYSTLKQHSFPAPADTTGA